MKPSAIMKPSLLVMQRLTALSALFAVCSAASAQNITWSGANAGTDIHWSDSANWLPTGLPGANDSVIFDNAGESSTAGTADNIVDSAFTIGSLWFAATNPSPTFAYHNTEINAGVTLTVSNTNAAIVLDSGTQTDPALGLTSSYSTIFGGGDLIVNDTNGESVMIVSQGSSSYTGAAGLWATLDMSGLSSFNGTFGRLLVGVQGVGATPGEVSLVGSGRQSGILSLAATNVIHLTQAGNIQGTGSAAAGGAALVINDSPFFGDYGSQAYLGQSNAIWADTITVGRIQCSRTAVMEFNPKFTAPEQLFLRGESSNRVSEFIVGDDTENTGACNAPPGSGIVVPPGGFQVGSAGLFDVSAGSSDMMIDTLIIGKGHAGSGGGYAAGIFNMGAGTLNVNTLELGVMSSSSENAPATGTLNIDGGAVTVNSGPVALGVTLGSPVTTYATGTLNITGGSLIVANGAYGINDDGLLDSTVELTNATVTAANIGSVSAPIGSLTMGDSTLNLTLNGLQGAVVAENLTTSSASVGNKLNVTSISGFVGVQSVVTLIQSDNAIAYAGTFTGGANESDFILGTLPAGYQGHLKVNPSSVQLVLTQTPLVLNTWTGTDIPSHNTNWSDGHNWSSGSEPSSTVPAIFTTTASVNSAATVNNIVDGDLTILGLDYANTNGTYQNTYISNNVTLTVGAGGLTVGSATVDEGNTTGNVTISGGGGTLNIDDSSAVIYVGLGHSNSASSAEATLDMSGLGTFTADAGTFLVGVGSVGFTSILQPAGTVYMARTNTITVSAGNGGSDSALVALDIGDAGDAEILFGDHTSSALFLGETNAIFADFIDVGRQWASGSMAFNPFVTNAKPAAYIRGASTGAVSRWNIGDGAGNLLPLGGGSGTVNFTGGTVDALVDTLNIATSSSNSVTASSGVTGTLTFDAGDIVASTVNLSDNPPSGGAYFSPGIGTINVDGTGTLIVSDTLNLGLTPGSQAGGTPTATLNINGGSVWANNVLAASNGTVSTINISGGWLGATNGIGTASAPVTSLHLTNSTIAEGAGNAPFINAQNITLGGSSNTLTILALPAIEVYPATLVVIQSATPIVGAFNFKVELPSNFSGIQFSESTDHTEGLLTVQSGPVTGRGIVHWVGPIGGNMNWTNAQNWFFPPMPAAPDTAYFDNVGESAAAGASFVDNVVNATATIAGLWYSATNASPSFTYHNTVINPGVTLTISNTGASILLDSGTQTDPSAGNTGCYNTISGGGAIDVFDTNTASVMIVSQGSSTYFYPSAGLWSSLDMSGLSTFEGTFGRLLLGIQGAGVTPGEATLNASGRQTGRLSLALTNVIHLTQTGNTQGGATAAVGGPALTVLDSGFFGDNGSILTLGQSNAIWADTITIGRNGALQSGVLQFNPSIAPPEQLFLRGESSNRVSEFIVADGTFNPNASQYEAPDARIVVTPQVSGGLNVQESGLVDVSAGTSDIMIDTLILGKGYNGTPSGYTVGQFNMGGGTLNVNTLELGVISSTSATVQPVTGILNVLGGTVVANEELVLGVPDGAGTASLAAGDVNITNGVLEAADIVASGSANSTITTSGGTLSLTSPSGSIGTAAAPIGSISLGNSTLNLALGGTGAAVVTSNLTFTGTSDTINLTAMPAIASTPSVVTLVQQLSGPISGSDFVLGTLPTGYAGTLQMSTDGTAVQLKVTSAPKPPAKGTTVTSVSLESGTSSFVISGTNGVANSVYYVLTSTNLTVWTPIATNSFDSNGDFSATLPYLKAENGRFYKIESQ
jgi:hypothetical protein